MLTANPAKHKQFVEYQKDKPNVLDLVRVVYYSIRNTIHMSFGLDDDAVEFYPMLIKHSMHYDAGLKFAENVSGLNCCLLIRFEQRGFGIVAMFVFFETSSFLQTRFAVLCTIFLLFLCFWLIF